VPHKTQRQKPLRQSQNLPRAEARESAEKTLKQNCEQPELPILLCMRMAPIACLCYRCAGGASEGAGTPENPASAPVLQQLPAGRGTVVGSLDGGPHLALLPTRASQRFRLSLRDRDNELSRPSSKRRNARALPGLRAVKSAAAGVFWNPAGASRVAQGGARVRPGAGGGFPRRREARPRWWKLDNGGRRAYGITSFGLFQVISARHPAGRAPAGDVLRRGSVRRASRGRVCRAVTGHGGAALLAFSLRREAL